MVELLAPAGSFESLKAAVHAGADAVYIGGSQFGARAYADNPDEEHLNMRWSKSFFPIFFLTIKTGWMR